MAQTFSKIYWGNSTPIGGAPCFWLDLGDTLYSFSFQQNNGRKINYRSFNRAGQVIDSTSYEWDSTVYAISIRPNSLKRVSNNRLVSIHDIIYQNSPTITNVFLVKNNLDTLKTTKFKITDSTDTWSFDLLIEDSVITILGQHVLPNKKLSLYIAQYDTTLNLLWYKTIADFRPIANQYFNGYFPRRIKRYSNNYYLTGYATYRNPDFVEDFIIKTDLQGNKIWDKRYQYKNKNSAGYDMLLFNDSIFRPSGFLSKVDGFDDYIKWHFMYLDTAGNIIQDSLYPDEEVSYQIESVTEAKDGNILLTGSYFWGGEKSVIWKMDKNLNTIWRRVYYYGDWEDESYLYNIGEWSDGGIASVGTYFDRYLNPTQKFVFLWILSTDANGCLNSTNCGSGIGYKEWAINTENVKIYPNPATEYIKVELPPNQTKGILRLYNTNGEMLLKTELQENKSTVFLPNLPNGTYMAEIDTQGKIYMKKLVVVQ